MYWHVSFFIILGSILFVTRSHTHASLYIYYYTLTSLHHNSYIITSPLDRYTHIFSLFSQLIDPSGRYDNVLTFEVQVQEAEETVAEEAKEAEHTGGKDDHDHDHESRFEHNLKEAHKAVDDDLGNRNRDNREKGGTDKVVDRKRKTLGGMVVTKGVWVQGTDPRRLHVSFFGTEVVPCPLGVVRERCRGEERIEIQRYRDTEIQRYRYTDIHRRYYRAVTLDSTNTSPSPYLHNSIPYHTIPYHIISYRYCTSNQIHN